MPLVPAICPKCKEPLQVDKEHDKTVCPSCHTEFITEQAINNYNFYNNTTNNYNIGHVDKVVIDNEHERLKAAADEFMRIREFGKAREKFAILCDNYPSDYYGWWGITQIDSCFFSLDRCTKPGYLSAKDSYLRAIDCAETAQETLMMKSQWEPFEKQFSVILDEKTRSYQQAVSNRENARKNINECNDYISSLNYDQNKLGNQIEKLKSIKKFKLRHYIFAIVFLIIGGTFLTGAIGVKDGPTLLLIFLPLFLLFARNIICRIIIGIKKRKVAKDKKLITFYNNRINQLENQISAENNKINALSTFLF